ncbi:hypothetical protein A3G63_02240 [Candidatus Kaiserbacteria bacterium RIFCSPLOWO2_12_FULL_52_8]|nr:MAG: hypothetical protein A3G63_02240 [Candidatus Kaiserbacteria bacterium RIFCSPLOWO2_12_FULL_52_8]
MKPGAIRWCRRILQKMGVLEWVCIILVGFLLLWQPKATLAFLSFLFLRKEVWSVAIAIFVFTCVFFYFYFGWLSKQPPPPVCPTCGQELPEERTHLATPKSEHAG